MITRFQRVGNSYVGLNAHNDIVAIVKWTDKIPEPEELKQLVLKHAPT